MNISHNAAPTTWSHYPRYSPFYGSWGHPATVFHQVGMYGGGNPWHPAGPSVPLTAQYGLEHRVKGSVVVTPHPSSENFKSSKRPVKHNKTNRQHIIDVEKKKAQSLAPENGVAIFVVPDPERESMPSKEWRWMVSDTLRPFAVPILWWCSNGCRTASARSRTIELQRPTHSYIVQLTGVIVTLTVHQAHGVSVVV